MKKVPTPVRARRGLVAMAGRTAAVLALAAASPAWGAGARVGGTADIVCESLNSGGVGYATNGHVKLGGSLGQSGFIVAGSGGVAAVHGGFWKPEDGCEMYPVALSSFVQATGRVALTFNVMWSNVYTVSAISQDEGGPMGGTHAWTNVVATFIGEGGMGSSTTIHEHVAAFAHVARFYVVRCEAR